ncbi:MAG: hypothetical protein ABJO82_10080, partial [Nonlabens ulvanivorans]
TPVDFKNKPAIFNIQAAGNVANTDLYKGLSISDLNIDNGKIKGQLFNSGTQELTIPQLIISYFDQNKNLVWVDYNFVKDAVRPQRKQNFEFNLLTDAEINVLNNDMSNCYVNGLPNQDVAKKVVPTRNATFSAFQKTDNALYPYIKLETNAYIGNPK